MNKVTLIATTTMGLEAICAREVKALGYEDVTVENGRVVFTSTVDAIPRANLWLRTADRIKILVGSFKALTFDELFEKTKALPWADLLPPHAEFPVIAARLNQHCLVSPIAKLLLKKSGC